MSEQPFDPSSVTPPSVPPTQAGPLTTVTPPSTWPTVIGVIAIVFGAGGILFSLLGLASIVFMEKLIESVDEEQAEMMQAAQGNAGWSIVLTLLGFTLAVMLLAGGIGVAKRRLWGVKVCRIWAILRIIHVLFGTVLGYIAYQKALETMYQQSSGATPMTPPPIFALLGVCFELVWGMALPVFMLIWFSRSRIKEEIKGWEVEAENPYRQGVR